MKKKRTGHPHPRPQAREPNLREQRKLQDIERLINRGQLDIAKNELLDLTRANPNLVVALDMLLDVAMRGGDLHLAYGTNTRLLQLEPGEETHHYNEIVIVTQLNLLFTLLDCCERYLKRFPDSANRTKITLLHGEAQKETARLRETDPMARQAADTADLRLFEQAQVMVSAGRYAEGRKMSLQAAEKLPGAPAPLNNVSLAYAVEGKLNEAIDYSQRALACDPDNLNARCNLAQYLVRVGRAEEARKLLDGLRAENPDLPDHWLKLAEAFAYAGDDAGVIEIYERGEKALKKERLPVQPYMMHLAAASYARTDDSKRAKALWQTALKHQPGLTVARDNLDDLRLPAGERNGAWHFELAYWLPREWLVRWEAMLRKNLKRSEEAFNRELVKFLDDNPDLKAVLPLLLDRGDSAGRDFALFAAKYSPVEGLLAFAQGSSGSDEHRMEAAQSLAEHGIIDRSQPFKYYSRGVQTGVKLLNFEIHSEPVGSDLPDEVQDHLEASHAAVHANDLNRAMTEIEAALALAPDTATLLNQKAVILGMQGHIQQSESLIRTVAQMHPDYFFARAAMAQLCAREKKFDEALDWLQPLMTQGRYHISEFQALAQAQIRLLSAQHDYKGVLSWEGMLSEMTGEDD